jgi:mannitol/fructose-specific phosphotransferase system IIA component (Ntr-type)
MILHIVAVALLLITVILRDILMLISHQNTFNMASNITLSVDLWLIVVFFLSQCTLLYILNQIIMKYQSREFMQQLLMSNSEKN